METSERKLKRGGILALPHELSTFKLILARKEDAAKEKKEFEAKFYKSCKKEMEEEEVKEKENKLPPSCLKKLADIS